MTLSALEIYLTQLQNFLIENVVLIAAVALSIWLLTSLGLLAVRHRDTRIDFLAGFFGVTPERIIPLPPGNALWHDYYRLNRDANADCQFPAGAPTLQGSYLIHFSGAMTLVTVHNFDKTDLYSDPEEPDLVDFAAPSLNTSGRTVAHRLPVDIDQDTANRANLVEFLLKIKFGYPGSVQAITLLRDHADIAPEPDTVVTPSGALCIA